MDENKDPDSDFVLVDDNAAQCGDGFLDVGETCDFNNFDGKTCADFGKFNDGFLVCQNACQTINFSNCKFIPDTSGGGSRAIHLINARAEAAKKRAEKLRPAAEEKSVEVSEKKITPEKPVEIPEKISPEIETEIAPEKPVEKDFQEKVVEEISPADSGEKSESTISANLIPVKIPRESAETGNQISKTEKVDENFTNEIRAEKIQVKEKSTENLIPAERSFSHRKVFAAGAGAAGIFFLGRRFLFLKNFKIYSLKK